MRWLAAALLVCAAAAIAPLPAHAQASCPNEALREERHLAFLPDCRAYEMVSPVEKNGGEVAGFATIFGGALLQGSAGGDEATFSSVSSFGAAAQGAPVASQYLSRRGADGWSTEDVTLPTLSGAYGEAPDGVPFRLFSGDLARGLVLNGRRCGEAGGCPAAYSLRESATGALAVSPSEPDLRFAGASPDLRHVVLLTCAALTPDATEVAKGEGCDPAAPNLYVWSGGQARLVNLLPGEAHGTPGASLAAQSGAISSDGSLVYWSSSEDGYLYLWDADGQTKWVSESAGGPGTFQTATPDGSLAFFTSTSSHLLRYRAATEAATDLTPGGEVTGLLGASEDGSRAYYVTPAGLFLWHEGAATKIAAAADPSDYPPATGAARVSADGARLAFVSSAPLTGYDNTDAGSGEPDSEVFLYDATANGGAGGLTCVSCNSPSKRPLGPSTLPGAIANGTTRAYKPRAMSAGGRRLFFDSADALLSQDTNNRPDVYEWEAQGEGSCASPGGCLGLISNGRGAEGASFVDASSDGGDAFFLTSASLVSTDPGAVDLYDAREDGGFPSPPGSIPCEGDVCQPLPSPPEDPTPGTLVPTPGNPPVRFPARRCAKGKRSIRAHGKRRCVAVRRRHHKPHRHRRRR